MNIYQECVDYGCVIVKDRINALLCAPLAGVNTSGGKAGASGEMLSTVLACQDKYLRVYAGEKLYHEFSVEGPGSALGFYGAIPENKRSNDPVLMMYGTEQGTIGICNIDSQAMRKSLGITERQQRLGVAGPTAGTRRARVSTLHTADVAKSGAHDILVGRDDGNFEVWSLGGANPARAAANVEAVPPTLLYETCLGESIQAMDSGNIAGGEHNEVILTTFGGKILGFTPDQAAQDPTGTDIAQVEDKPVLAPGAKKRVLTASEENTVKVEKERRFKQLEGDVDKLKQQLSKEKLQYQQLSSESIAVQTTTKVSHRFNLNGEEACYVLTVESQAPLGMISLRADVDVDLLDHEGTSAILSRSKGDPANPLLATYRMQEPGSRFQVKLRTVEGLNGMISCFVLPQTNPKTAHLVTLAVKPLSLHEKITEVPADIPMNELRLTGNFTVMDMHQWLGLCVNELPSRPTDEEMVICYTSTFVGTFLQGKYARGYATFKSDSVSTIGVLKDLMTREATNVKIQVTVNVEVKEETFPRFLELIHPKLAFQHSLSQQVRMVEPLREVQLQEGETKFLAQELQMVLQRAGEIQSQFELQPQRLAFLHNIVCAAYRDKWRLKGHQSVEHRLKELQKLLENYNVEQITTFFADPID